MNDDPPWWKTGAALAALLEYDDARTPIALSEESKKRIKPCPCFLEFEGKHWPRHQAGCMRCGAHVSPAGCGKVLSEKADPADLDTVVAPSS